MALEYIAIFVGTFALAFQLGCWYTEYTAEKEYEDVIWEGMKIMHKLMEDYSVTKNEE
jgi:hypothetical protein